MMLNPLDIYFCQDTISSKFRIRCRHSNKRIGETLDELCEGRLSIYHIPTISVMKKNGKWFTADNRRLWVFRELERLGKCESVPVNLIDDIPYDKFTTENGGASVEVRGEPGGTISSRTARPSLSSVPLSSSYRLKGYTGSSSLTPSLLEHVRTVSRPASETISQAYSFSRGTSNYFNTREQSVQVSVSSLSIPGSTYVKYVDPQDCRFLKPHVESTFDDGRSCNLLTQSLIHGLTSYRNVAAVKAYEAYDQYYIKDGNRRLKAFRDATNSITDIQIKVEVIGDEDDLLDEIRKEDPAITAFEVMQLGETIEWA